MEIRSTTKVSNKVKKQVKPPKVSVKIRLLHDVRYRYSQTGKTYEWNRAGSIQRVPIEVSSVLLAKVRAGGCCGDRPSTRNLFEEVLT